MPQDEFDIAALELRKLVSSNVNEALEQCLHWCTRAEQTTNVKKKAEIYHITGLAYHHIYNYDQALHWYVKATDVRQAIPDEAGLSTSLNNIGLVYLDMAQYHQAVEYLEKSISLKLKTGDEKSLAAGYENLGVAYQRQLLYKEAIEKFYASLQISEKNNDVERKALTYQNIGNMHLAMGDDIEALNNFEKALALKQNTTDYQHIIQLLNNMAVANKQLARSDKALDYYQQCLQLCAERNYTAELSAVYNNIGELFLYDNELDKAADAYNKSIAIAIKANNSTDVMVAEMNLGIVYLKKDNYEESEKNLLSSLNRYSATSHHQGIYLLYESLIDLYERKGELSNALHHFRIYDQLKYKQLNGENSKVINELKTKYEVEKKEKENEIHRLRNIELKDALEDLTLEKRRSEKLLLNILPEEIAYELKRTGKVKAKMYQSVSVLFTDIKSFTTHSEKMPAENLVNLLDFYFQAFDDIITSQQIEKIKTIGDAYLCVAGLPQPNTMHAVILAGAALQMQSWVNDQNEKRKAASLPFFEFRIGIHSGPVIAGIVGKAKFEYDVWGDTVNTAARMEQSGATGKINISEATYDLIKHKFACSDRGKIEAKNKGSINMYFVDGEL